MDIVSTTPKYSRKRHLRAQKEKVARIWLEVMKARNSLAAVQDDSSSSLDADEYRSVGSGDNLYEDPSDGHSSESSDPMRTSDVAESYNVSDEFRRWQLQRSSLQREETEDEDVPMHESPHQQDPDRMFLLSVLTDLQSIPDSYKLEAKSEILQVLLKYKKRGSK